MAARAGHEILHGRRTLIAPVRHGNCCARHIVINAQIGKIVGQNPVERLRYDRPAQPRPAATIGKVAILRDAVWPSFGVNPVRSIAATTAS